MKILHATTASGPIAGTERLLADIASVSNQEQFEYAVVTIEPWGELNDLVESAGCTSYSLGVNRKREMVDAIRKLRRTIRNHEPDLVHAHLHHASILCALATIGTGIPFVQTRHYSDLLHRYGARLNRRLDRWAVHRAAHVIAISDQVRRFLIDIEHVSPKKVTRIYNGIQFNGPSKSKNGKLDGPSIGLLATYHPRKGHKTLLEAFDIVSERHPSACLRLAGKDTDGTLCKNAIARTKSKQRIEALGFVSDKGAFLDSLDIYVQPSHEEGFGISVIEAMDAGIPVIVSAVGGLKEIVIDGVTGRLVPPNDPHALAATILDDLDHRDERSERAQTAAVDVREKFGVDRMLAEYENVYRTFS